MDTFTRISVRKPMRSWGQANVTIVDIRDANSFAQGHIAQAQNVNDENIKDFLQRKRIKKPL
jgi:thiosulfate sulfurtransferase